MKYLTFSKLKAYKKASCLSKKLKEISKQIPKVEESNLRFRIKNNTDGTLKFIKLVWLKRHDKEHFIEYMDEVIVNNSELEILLSEIMAKGFINKKIYEEFLNECQELRKYQLAMFNGATIYFEDGKIPENWFDLE